MKRIAHWLVLAFLTFLIGVTATFLYLKFHSATNQETEFSPNLPVLNNKFAEIPTLTFCELSSNPRKYDGKIVRLNATLSFNQEGRWFDDIDCKTSNGGIDPYVENREVWKPIETAKVENYRKYDSHELDLTVVGKFKVEDTKGGYVILPFQIEILQVEKISKSKREIIWEY